MKPDGFVADLRRKPEMLQRLATSLAAGNPWSAVVPPGTERVVLIGMGSSAYAGGVAAARMRVMVSSPRRSWRRHACNRAVHVFDLERDFAEALRQPRDGEAQAGLGVKHPAKEQQQDQDERADYQRCYLEPAFHQSFGEKLMCRRGPGRRFRPDGQRLRDVHAERNHRQAKANAEAHRILSGSPK